MIKKFGLRTEILITLTLLLGAALLLGGLMMLRLTEKSLLEERVHQLDSVSYVLGKSLIISASHGREDSGLQLNGNFLGHLSDNLGYDGWWIYDRNLNLLNSYTVGQVSPLSLSHRQQIKFSGEPYRSVDFPTLLNLMGNHHSSAHFVIPLTDKSRFLGLLELHYSLDDIRVNLAHSLRVVFLYILLYGAILVVAGYYLLQRNIILPARQLLFATESVGQGNLETRLPVSGPLEISRLATAYNQMVGALLASHQQTQVHISELEGKNAELQQIRKELLRNEKLASIGQMGAGLAHEIGNPLAALIGYLELLRSQLSCPDSTDIVERSLVEAQRIDFLVRDLLDFATPSVNSKELIDPVIVLVETVDLLKHQGAFNNHSINLDLPHELPKVKINRHQLQQVCVNLILNAIQASAKSGAIRLSAGWSDLQVWLSVQDEGCGIAEKDIGHLFDPFFTTRKTGRGLGLSICHKIIEDAGGSINVQSELEMGSLFSVFLPINGCI